MQVSVSGQHLPMKQSLQDYAKNRLTEVVAKYFEQAPSAHIHFAKNANDFHCDIIVNDGTGRHVIMKSDGSSDEIHTAFDIAIMRIEKQLRKYKSRLKDRHDRVKLSEIDVSSKAVKYVISRNNQDEEEPDLDNPVIVAEKPIDVLSLSVGDAVMHMDLENLPALMFRNNKTHRINVVYYRKDGNISWVDSK
jgi:ribosomal subunit interface protein